ncbi:hypothetical protein KIPE111705_24705 [Kibdelosporangium persicum]
MPAASNCTPIARKAGRTRPFSRPRKATRKPNTTANSRPVEITVSSRKPAQADSEVVGRKVRMANGG